jgi:glutathione S-transferase
VWLLNELGGDYKKFNINEHKSGFNYIKSEEYGKINPNHLIPAITIGKNESLFEAGAILRYLLRRYKNNLIPKDWKEENWERHHLYEFWCITTSNFSIHNPSRWKNRGYVIRRVKIDKLDHRVS